MSQEVNSSESNATAPRREISTTGESQELKQGITRLQLRPIGTPMALGFLALCAAS